MGITRPIKIIILLITLFLAGWVTPLFCQEHIKEMDTVRNSMISTGNKMPEMIKNSKNNEMRTLERVYEINTYALTTIEAYFKMIKVAISTDGSINKNIVDVFNGWLGFISRYCKKDIAYLDEALSDMKDPAIIDVIKATKKNIMDLNDIAFRAIDENSRLLLKR
jgi:hypothetical protein